VRGSMRITGTIRSSLAGSAMGAFRQRHSPARSSISPTCQ
jgi:hypothetical protein